MIPDFSMLGCNVKSQLLAASSAEDRHCISKTYDEHLSLKDLAFSPHSNPMGREVDIAPRLRLGVLLACTVCCRYRAQSRSTSQAQVRVWSQHTRQKEVITRQGKVVHPLKWKYICPNQGNVISIAIQSPSSPHFFSKSSSFVRDALR